MLEEMSAEALAARQAQWREHCARKASGRMYHAVHRESVAGKKILAGHAFIDEMADFETDSCARPEEVVARCIGTECIPVFSERTYETVQSGPNRGRHIWKTHGLR